MIVCFIIAKIKNLNIRKWYVKNDTSVKRELQLAEAEFRNLVWK